jgi:hypothetical protein
MNHKTHTHRKNTSSIPFRPFPIRTTSGADLRRRAYHLAGHALMMERFLPENFYLLLYGPNIESEARRGEIDILDMRNGSISWGSAATGGLTSPPEWTEILVPCPTPPPTQQALILAAGCAAEQLLAPSLAEEAQEQAVGDRAYFLNLGSSGSWDQSIEEAVTLLTTDRSALDKIAEAVEGSLQTVRQIPSGGLPGGFPLPAQFREAALFSPEIKALAHAARQPGGGIEHGYSLLRRVRAIQISERMGQSER